MNKKLTIDRALANTKRFEKKALDGRLVQRTSTGSLSNEGELPAKWYRR